MMFDEKNIYVIMKDENMFIRTEFSDIYDVNVRLTSSLEDASFFSLDGARTVISELTGLSNSKYHYHAMVGYEDVVKFNPGDLIIVEVKYKPTALCE